MPALTVSSSIVGTTMGRTFSAVPYTYLKRGVYYFVICNLFIISGPVSALDIEIPIWEQVNGILCKRHTKVICSHQMPPGRIDRCSEIPSFGTYEINFNSEKRVLLDTGVPEQKIIGYRYEKYYGSDGTMSPQQALWFSSSAGTMRLYIDHMDSLGIFPAQEGESFLWSAEPNVYVVSSEIFKYDCRVQ